MFTDLVFCLSGPLKGGRDKFSTGIKWQNGRVHRTVSAAVTHLVANEASLRAEPKKLAAARQHNLWIVTQEFVLSSIKKRKRLDEAKFCLFDSAAVATVRSAVAARQKHNAQQTAQQATAAAAQAQADKAAAKAIAEQSNSTSSSSSSSSSADESGGSLYDVVVCLSGTLSDRRSNLIAKFKKYGIKVASSIIKTCTHLVSNSIEVDKRTSKVKKAEANSLPIVKEDFLHDSIATGHLLPVSSYLVSNKSTNDDDDDDDDDDYEAPTTKKRTATKKRKATKRSRRTADSDDDDDDDEEAKPAPKKKAKTAGKIFKNDTFCITGTMSMVRKAFAKIITSHGGKVKKTVSSDVNVLVTTANEVDKPTKKAEKAIDNEIFLVSEEFITDSVAKGKRLSENDYLLYDPDGAEEEDDDY